MAHPSCLLGVGSANLRGQKSKIADGAQTQQYGLIRLGSGLDAACVRLKSLILVALLRIPGTEPYLEPSIFGSPVFRYSDDSPPGRFPGIFLA